MIDHVDEVGTGDICGARARTHRELVAKRAACRLAHAGDVEVLAEHGRRLDVEIVERDDSVQALGAGIASVVNVLDIEGVVIGGGLGVRFGDPCTKRIAQEMQPHLFIDSRPPAVHVAALGDLGGALGAALLVDGDRPPPAPG